MGEVLQRQALRSPETSLTRKATMARNRKVRRAPDRQCSAVEQGERTPKERDAALSTGVNGGLSLVAIGIAAWFTARGIDVEAFLIGITALLSRR
ncbi:hypothetical protein [Nonomuraea ceibae]|uniref:hypothetical protein n=1 Tax=Nonomuraea ceibae TaxID=1935170 RepID=UPI001C6006CE|nr:hypothetical protein [Nonomuraea ceibae]